MRRELLRSSNERMADWEERRTPGRRDLNYCECGGEKCRARLTLALDTYATLRHRRRGG